MAVLRLVPATGNPVEITEDTILVGREPTCDVVIPDGSISRRHARIEKRPQGYTVVDQGSANGTFIDSQRVAESVVRNGQELRFGAVAFKVQIEDDDLSATVVASLNPDRTLSTPGMPSPVVATPPLPVAPVAPPKPATPIPPPALPKAGPPPLRSNPTTDPVATPRRPAPPAVPPPPPSGAAAKDRFAGNRPGVATDPGAPPPARKGRGAGFWIGAGCVGCLVILVLLALAGFGGYLAVTSGPATAAEAQLKRLKENPQAFYLEASEAFRQECSESDFAAFLAQHPGLISSKPPSVGWQRSMSWDSNVGGRASVNATVEDASGRRETARVALVNQGDAWKIAGIAFDGGGDGCR